MATWYVATTGNDSTGNGSSVKPYKTIQKGATKAQAGDTVSVASGTYTITQGIVTSTSGTLGNPITFISATALGAKIVGSGVVYLWTNRGNYVVIKGFEITGNSAAWIGILNNASYCTCDGNYIHDIQAINTGTLAGAGIDHAYYGAIGNTTINNVISNIGTIGTIDPATGNLALGVHGIYQGNPYGVITNNIVSGAQAYGIHTWHAASTLTIESNLVFNCGAGGILLASGDAPGDMICDDCVIANNISCNMQNNYGYGIYETNSVGSPNRNFYVNNCVYNNLTPTSLQAKSTAVGTVTGNPNFVTYQADGSGNYQLGAGSSCTGTGTAVWAPATNILGTSWPGNIGPY